MILGYARSPEGLAILRATTDLTDKQIYLEGRGAETLAACLRGFRGSPNTLIVAAPATATHTFGNVRIVGISPEVWHNASDLVSALLKAKNLRKLISNLQ